MLRSFAAKSLKGLLAVRKWCANVRRPEPRIEVKFIECVHRGIGDPSYLIGELGHWYLDQAACVLWGPKTTDGWPPDPTRMLRNAMQQFNVYDQSRLDAVAYEFVNNYRRNKGRERFDV